jgi:hypothetical protein
MHMRSQVTAHRVQHASMVTGWKSSPTAALELQQTSQTTTIGKAVQNIMHGASTMPEAIYALLPLPQASTHRSLSK